MRRLHYLVIATVLGLPVTAFAGTLQVGADKPYTTIAAAVADAGAGDTVEIDPGEYVDDIVVINQGNLTLRGVGDERAHLSSTQQIGNGKGIILVNVGAEIVTVEHLEISGATVADGNGAGIRMQGSALVVRDCHIHENENGILAGGSPSYTVEVYDSEFDHNGVPGSGQEHNIYVSGEASSFIFQGNYSHHAYSGHTFKSRAQTSWVLYNRLMDEADGTSSYLIDLPQGGLSFVIGNLIEQGPMAENHGTIISYKREDQTNDDLHLYLVNNTIVNDNAAETGFVRVGAADEIVMRNNLIVGPGMPLVLENGITPMVTDEGNLQTDTPGLVDRAGYDYHLADGSAAIDAGVAPGMGSGEDLTPTMHYEHPASTVARPVVDALDIGAYEFGMGPPAGDTSGSDGGGDSSGSGGEAGTDGGSASGSAGDSASGSAGDSASASAGSESDGSGGAEDTAGAGDDGSGGCGCSTDTAPRTSIVALFLLAHARRRRRSS
jgi:MYXO-CTERM domain-containing protein